MEDRELSPMEVYCLTSKGECVPPVPAHPLTMAEYIEAVYRADLNRLNEKEHARLTARLAPKPKPKTTRPDFHGLTLIRGGKDKL